MTIPSVSVILPAYNEREAIVSLLADLLAETRSAGLDPEITVVDDDSPDGTAEAVRSAFPGEPSIRVEVRRGARGLATAIRRGLELARGEVVVLMDADGNHSPAALPMMARLAGAHDLVVGSRYVPGGGARGSRLRFWSTWGFNLLARAALGLQIRDNTGGYLAFRRTLLDGAPLDVIFRGHGDYALRLIWWCARAGLSIVEAPVVYEPRRGGRSKTPRLAWAGRYLAAVARLRLRGLR